MNKKQHTDLIKQEALKLGFLDCGIASPEPLNERGQFLASWLKNGYNGTMSYMENHFDIRVNPHQFFPGANSVIMVIISYHSTEKQKDPAAPKISKYVYGRDYHKVIRKKLKQLESVVTGISDQAETRIFVDTSPVMEKAMARRAGLGWTGKHSVLLSRNYGSFFFIGGIMTNLELPFDKPEKESCGNCTLCIDACPTGAIVAPYVLDARKCISCLTIGHKGESLPEEFRDKMSGYVFGCDICQDVCPWNKNVKPHIDSDFTPETELLEMTRDDWHEMDEDRFNDLFKDSAVKRSKYEGIRRNLNYLKI